MTSAPARYDVRNAVLREAICRQRERCRIAPRNTCNDARTPTLQDSIDPAFLCGLAHWRVITNLSRVKTQGARRKIRYCTTFTSVPIGSIVMAISSPLCSVNESGGTMPVPVIRKQPTGNELSR